MNTQIEIPQKGSKLSQDTIVKLIEAWQTSDNTPEVITKMGWPDNKEVRGRINIAINNLRSNGVKMKNIRTGAKYDYKLLANLAAKLANGSSK